MNSSNRIGTRRRPASEWAQRQIAAAAAVIVDYETCSLDGPVCEVAVIAADTGEVLVNSLIDPCGPISAAATDVHGITADEVAGAPTFAEILPVLEQACAGRTVLAYSAEFDYGRTVYECRRWNRQSPLTNLDRWDCVMVERSTWLGRRRPRHLRLGGNHRALGDVTATRSLLHTMAGVDSEATMAAGVAV